MNLLKDLIEKHSGQFSGNTYSETDSSFGKFKFQPENGMLSIGGSSFSFSNEKVSNAENLSIKLHLNKDNQSELEIFPKSRFQQMRNSVFGSGTGGMERKFSFRGDEILIVNIISSKSFLRLLGNEKVHIKIANGSLDIIELTPENQTNDLEKFEKYLEILKALEKNVVQFNMTAQIAS